MYAAVISSNALNAGTHYIDWDLIDHSSDVSNDIVSLCCNCGVNFLVLMELERLVKLFSYHFWCEGS